MTWTRPLLKRMKKLVRLLQNSFHDVLKLENENGGRLRMLKSAKRIKIIH